MSSVGNLALRGAAGFGIGAVVAGALGEFVGFPVGGIIGGSVLASSARKLSAMLLAAFGFALGVSVAGGLVLAMGFGLAVGKASALEVAVIWAVVWAIGGGIAAPFLGPTIVRHGHALRALAALALAGGLAFGFGGLMGGLLEVLWPSPLSFELDIGLAMLTGGTLTGGGLGWLARDHPRRPRPETPVTRRPDR
jgi:hypothetical protein